MQRKDARITSKLHFQHQINLQRSLLPTAHSFKGNVGLLSQGTYLGRLYVCGLKPCKKKKPQGFCCENKYCVNAYGEKFTFVSGVQLRVKPSKF